MQNSGPAVLCLGNTQNSNFPLILIFGRENNNTGNVYPGIGPYSFTQSPRSAFWNRAYAAIDRICSCLGHFKNNCRYIHRCSPIVFTNIFPLCIRNSVGNKNRVRSTINPNQISAFITDLFSLSMVNSRVKMVIVSVGNDPVFGDPKQVIASECRSRKIRFSDVPYFAYSGNTNTMIDTALQPRKNTICNIVSPFC